MSVFDPSTIRVLTAAELDEFRDTGPRFLTTEPLKVAARGRNVIHGPSNVYKTYFGLHASVQVSSKGERVVVFVGEGDEVRIADRLRGLCDALGVTLPTLGDRLVAVFGAPPIDADEGADALLRLVREVRPELTVVDPLASFFLADENRSDTVARVLSVLDRVIAEKSGVLLVHHDRKISRDVGRDMRGHGRLRAWADTIAGFEERDGHIVVHDEKQRDIAKSEPRAYVVRFDDAGGVRIERQDGVPSSRERRNAAADAKLLDQARAVLAQGPATKHAIRVALSLSGTATDKLLNTLLSIGEVEKRRAPSVDARGRETVRDAYVRVAKP